jgi:hypothetical protein
LCYYNKAPEADYLIKKRVLLVHSSEGSGAWHWHLLSSGEGLMTDGMTMAGMCAEEVNGTKKGS